MKEERERDPFQEVAYGCWIVLAAFLMVPAMISLLTFLVLRMF